MVELGVLTFFAVVIGGFLWARRWLQRRQPQVLCDACGTVGWPKSKTPGSFAIEIVLWFCFIIPGVIYSLWRMTSRKQVCSACGSPNTIPASSPKAQRILAQQR